MALSKRLRNKISRRSAVRLEVLEDRHVLTTLTGFVFEDLDLNGVRDEVDPPIAGAVVFLDTDMDGQLDQSGFGMEPDDYAEGAVLNNASQLVFPSVAGIDNQPISRVLAVADSSRATTGDLVFGHDETSFWSNSERLRFDFTLPVDSASLDVFGISAISNTTATLEAYDSNDQLLTADTASLLLAGDADRLSIEREQSDIQYLIARVSSNRGEAAFDNLRADNSNDERSTVTSSIGSYFFFGEANNQSFTVTLQATDAYEQTSPEGAIQTPIGDAVTNLNFGNQTSSIGGVVFNDVGESGVYEPGLDVGIANAVVYLDVNGNGMPDAEVTSIDPGVYLSDEVLEYVNTDVRLRATGADNVPVSEVVTSDVDLVVSQDGHVFTRNGDAAWTTSQRLRADFASPASRVQLDFIGASETAQQQGILIAYSASGDELVSMTTTPLSKGERETMEVDRLGFDISYVVAYTVGSSVDGGRLDNMAATIVDEPIAIANEDGEYLFKPLEDGDYRVEALPLVSQTITLPNDDTVRQISVTDGADELEADFGIQLSNDPPVAANDTISTIEEGLVAIGVLVNDFDPDGVVNEGSVEITQNPINGTAVVTANGLINYTPNANFAGTDTLLYTIRDDQATVSNSATVTITVTPVNDAPNVVNDAVSVLQSAPTTIDVLRNDSDVDGTIDPTTVEIGLSPANGTVAVDPATGNITYTPTSGGDDAFTYTVEDDLGLPSSAATVTITARTIGSSPVARNDSIGAFEGTRTLIEVLENDSDVDGLLEASTVTILTQPEKGTATVSDGVVEYQPILGFIGQDEFTYQVRDDNGLASNAAMVTIDLAERDFPLQNPMNALDVNPDGFIIPRDALIIINEINNRRLSDPLTGQIAENPEPGSLPAAYYDVTGDGFIVANDVLRIVNFLNAQANAEPPETVLNSTANQQAMDAAIAATFATDFDAFGDDEDDTA